MQGNIEQECGNAAADSTGSSQNDDAEAGLGGMHEDSCPGAKQAPGPQLAGWSSLTPHYDPATEVVLRCDVLSSRAVKVGMACSANGEGQLVPAAAPMTSALQMCLAAAALCWRALHATLQASRRILPQSWVRLTRKSPAGVPAAGRPQGVIALMWAVVLLGVALLVAVVYVQEGQVGPGRRRGVCDLCGWVGGGGMVKHTGCCRLLGLALPAAPSSPCARPPRPHPASSALRAYHPPRTPRGCSRTTPCRSPTWSAPRCAPPHCSATASSSCAACSGAGQAGREGGFWGTQFESWSANPRAAGRAGRREHSPCDGPQRRPALDVMAHMPCPAG